jgi:hypothetical protein
MQRGHASAVCAQSRTCYFTMLLVTWQQGQPSVDHDASFLPLAP